MKNKLIKYLLSSLFTFFVVIGITKAEDRGIYIPRDGSSVQFIDGTSYLGTECSGADSLQYFVVSKTPGESYVVKLKDNINASSGSESLTCTYMTHYGMVGDTRKLLDTDGSITFNFSFTSSVEDMKINATLSKYDPILDIRNYLPNFYSISKSELDANGQQYLDNQCMGDQCSFQVKDDTFNTLSGKDIEVNGNVVYKTSDGEEVNIELHITIIGFYNILASAGDYGVCNFDTSIWETTTYSSNSYKAKYDDSTRGRISLPNCDASNSAAAAKFYGWVYINPNDTIQESQNVMVSNVCKNYPKVDGNLDELINAGVDKFYTCYETTGSLYLNPAGGTIDVESSWQEQDGKYLIVQDTNFTLPEIKQFPSYLVNNENNKVSYYWQASNDRNKKYKAGDTVTPSGQTFTAIYETDTFIETHLYEYSVMYVGDSQIYALTTVKFDTCSTNSSSFVTVSPDGETGGCMMNALKETPEGQTIEVYGYNAEKDQTYTLNLRILSRLGTTEGGDNEFIIKFDEYAIAGYGQTGNITPTPVGPGPNEPGEITSDTVAKPSCEEYNIKILYADQNPYKSLVSIFTPSTKPTSKISSTIKYDSGSPDNVILHHDSFRATCADTSQDSKSYATVCLDPGVRVPSVVYEKDPYEIGLSKDVVNFLYYAIQNSEYQSKLVETYSSDSNPLGYENHKEDLANTHRVAVNFVARLINAKNGNLRFSNEEKYALTKYYYGFIYLASNFEDLNVVWSPTNESHYKYIDKIEVLWKKYYSGSIPEPTIHETKQSNVVVEINENVATFSGELSLPSDIKLSETTGNGIVTGDNVKAKMVCASGLKCEIVSISKTNFEFNVTFDDPEMLKNMENIKMYLYFRTFQDKRALVFLDDKSGTTQRMVIFKDEQVYVFRYGGEVNSGVCDLNDYPTDPSSFTPAQKQDFMNKNCCQLITNRYDLRYQEFCGDKCNKVTYSIACDTDLTYDSLDGQRDYDVYTVNEGFDKSTNTEQIGACVVDVTKASQNKNDNRINTDGITDAVGNALVLPDYKENQYCRVSCKEDWNLKTPGFKNFVGEYGAVKAGQYFRLNEEIFLGGTRTCVTTYIDYKHYHDDVKILSGQMVAAYNSYVESKTAYDKAKEEFSMFRESNDEGNPTSSTYGAVNPYKGPNSEYITAYNQVGEPQTFCRYGKDENDNCLGPYTAYYYEVAETKECPIYNVHVPNGAATEKVFYDNKNFSSVGTKTTNGEYYNTKFTYGDGAGWYESAPNVGTCQSIDEKLDNFDALIPKITYKSKHDNYASFKNYNRYDGNLPDDVWETPSGTLKDNMDYAKKEMIRIKKDLNGKVKDMGACQNFYMNNTINDSENYFFGKTVVEQLYKDIGKGYGYDAGSQTLSFAPTEIASPYEPDIRYQYEEYEYMTLVGDNNYLIPDAKENNKVVGEGAQNICKDTDMVDSNGKTIQLCVNKINTYGYKSENGWTNKGEGKTYGGESYKNDGKSTVSDSAKTETLMVCMPDGDSVKCENGNFYYYELNYIKQNLSNGGYYRNYGDFYTSQYSDVKIFAPSREEAFRQASAAGSTATDWGPLGGNSFPIGLDTRRNIYQYMFSFGNVGIYNDTNQSGIEPTMGRIIGGHSSGTNTSTNVGGESITTSKPAVVADHTHACFYEVFEELCQCCGLPVTTLVVMPSKVSTQDYLSDFGYNFSDDDKNSSSGTLGFYTSTVSLYDLDGVPNKEELATNWSNDDTFRVYGNTYSTNKGEELANAIVSVGEEIYNREPEYSYTLDPAAMAEIRDYNELHGYEHSIKTMKNYKVCAIASDSGQCNETLSSNYTEDDTIVFAHYGSEFLEDLDTKYTTEGYKNLSTRKDICSITSGELGSGSSYIDLKKGTYNHCRWVDYLMTADEAKFIKGDNTVVEMNDVTHFRLAFK